MSKFRKLFGPGQFVADATQANEAEEMIQGRSGLRLALKPGEDMRIPGCNLMQKLQRDQTVRVSSAL
jgi:hypothetical protein